MKIRHLTHSGLLVEEAGRRVLVDPGSFSRESVEALEAPVRAAIDVVAITHQHPDHVDRALLEQVLAESPQAVVVAEPQTAQQLAEPAAEGPMGPAAAVDPGRVITLAAGASHELEAVAGEEPLHILAVGGQHAIIHPDIPRVGNTGLVLSAGDGPRLGITGDSLEPVEEFHGIDALAFAVVAPWSKMAETVDFLRAVRPVLALPVHEAVASTGGRAVYMRQASALAPEGTEVRAWPEDRLVEVAAG